MKIYRHNVTFRGDPGTIEHLDNKDGFRPKWGDHECEEGTDGEGRWSTFNWLSEEPVEQVDQDAITKQPLVLDWEFNREDPDE
jgi:hypothetical protein